MASKRKPEANKNALPSHNVSTTKLEEQSEARNGAKNGNSARRRSSRSQTKIHITYKEIISVDQDVTDYSQSKRRRKACKGNQSGYDKVGNTVIQKANSQQTDNDRDHNSKIEKESKHFRQSSADMPVKGKPTVKAKKHKLKSQRSTGMGKNPEDGSGSEFETESKHFRQTPSLKPTKLKSTTRVRRQKLKPETGKLMGVTESQKLVKNKSAKGKKKSKISMGRDAKCVRKTSASERKLCGSEAARDIPAANVRQAEAADKHDKLTADKSDRDEDDSESEWEDVADLPGLPSSPAKIQLPTEPIEITIDAPDIMRTKIRAGEGWDPFDWFRLAVNRMKREDQLNAHKTHLLCLLVVNQRRNRLCCQPLLQAVVLSAVPVGYTKLTPSRWSKKHLDKLCSWFTDTFTINSKLPNTPENKLGINLMSRVETSKVATPSELVLLFVALVRGLGLHARYVVSLRPLPIKASDLIPKPKGDQSWKFNSNFKQSLMKKHPKVKFELYGDPPSQRKTGGGTSDKKPKEIVDVKRDLIDLTNEESCSSTETAVINLTKSETSSTGSVESRVTTCSSEDVKIVADVNIKNRKQSKSKLCKDKPSSNKPKASHIAKTSKKKKVPTATLR